MIKWLQLTAEQRKAAVDQAEQLGGIRAKAIEKDWWVTLVLRTLFQTPYAHYLVFKGGTSLSKCWGLTGRFSEDIDIALDPTVLGMPYIDRPTRSHVNRLKRRGCEFTSNELRVALEQELIAMGVSARMIAVTAAPVRQDFPDTDPQTILVTYPSLYEQDEYLPDVVKIEVSVRSLQIPFTSMAVSSMLDTIARNPVYAEEPFTISVVEPRKTFLEKVMLLHEEFCKPDIARIRTQRMSRHFYDLYRMMQTQVADEALADKELYAHLIIHREYYSNISWVDYKLFDPETISFLPPQALEAAYDEDYRTMQEAMIYEQAPEFSELLRSMRILRCKMRLVRYGQTLAELETIAKVCLAAPDLQPSEDDIYSIDCSPASDEALAEGAEARPKILLEYKKHEDNFQLHDLKLVTAKKSPG